jgi:hypothetical protein
MPNGEARVSPDAASAVNTTLLPRRDDSRRLVLAQGELLSEEDRQCW